MRAPGSPEADGEVGLIGEKRQRDDAKEKKTDVSKYTLQSHGVSSQLNWKRLLKCTQIKRRSKKKNK